MQESTTKKHEDFRHKNTELKNFFSTLHKASKKRMLQIFDACFSTVCCVSTLLLVGNIFALSCLMYIFRINNFFQFKQFSAYNDKCLSILSFLFFNLTRVYYFIRCQPHGSNEKRSDKIKQHEQEMSVEIKGEKKQFQGADK